MASKTCTACKQEKPLGAFSKAGLWNGTQLYKGKCKDCTNESMRASRADQSRVHFENVRDERCPHGKGIRRVPVTGWGYLVGAAK